MSAVDPDGFVARQLRLMSTRLREFQQQTIPIGKVIGDLEGLLWALEGRVPQEWFDSVLEQWGELEVSYAVALDQLTPIPDTADLTVREATEEMLRLVTERLTSPQGV